MFPISWSDIFRKKDGSLVNMEDALSGGGGGGSIPPHSAADAGKVLGVADDGSLAWITVSGDNRYSSVDTTGSLAEINIKEGS